LWSCNDMMWLSYCGERCGNTNYTPLMLLLPKGLDVDCMALVTLPNLTAALPNVD